MKSITKRMGEFCKRLHKDESAPNTVEWVLLVIVALIVMIAIYFIAQWVLQGGAEEGKQVEEMRGKADTKAKDIGKALKVE